MDVKYSHRILCDSHFLMWLSQQEFREAILSNLIHIKSSSTDWKKTHNIILKDEAEKCTKLTPKYLGGAFKIHEEPKFVLEHSDPISRNIVYAIELTDEIPYKCYLLTSPDKLSSYLTNDHMNGIQSTKIVAGESALQVIKSFFDAFKAERENARL